MYDDLFLFNIFFADFYLVASVKCSSVVSFAIVEFVDSVDFWSSVLSKYHLDSPVESV